jgi:hypothetical protein
MATNFGLGNYPRILSRPVKLSWAGWETDTFRLQQAGWTLSAEQDYAHCRMRLAFNHDQIDMRGYTQWIEGAGGMTICGQPLEWAYAAVKYVGRTLMIHEHDPFNFQTVDALPRMALGGYKDLSDLAHFAPAPLVRTQALVLPEEDVDARLSRILEKQQAAKTDYFRDLVRKQGQDVPAHKFHAQIITLPRAA